MSNPWDDRDQFNDALDMVLWHLTRRVHRIEQLMLTNMRFESQDYNDVWAIKLLLTSKDEVWLRMTREEKVQHAIDFLESWHKTYPEFP